MPPLMRLWKRFREMLVLERTGRLRLGKIRVAAIRAWLLAPAPEPLASWLKTVFGCFAVLILNGAGGGEQRQIECVALNIYFEARNEPEAGRRAVAHVVLNRRWDARWPNTPCAVIAQGWPEDGRLCQFSWYCDGLSDTPRSEAPWRDALTLAREAYWGRSADPTGGAYWYHADYVAPPWRKRLHRGPKIGRHIFYWDRGAKQSL